MSEMCDISNVKQEVTDDETNNQPHTYILPHTDINQEDMQLTHAEEMKKETDDVDYKLQPSFSKTSTGRGVRYGVDFLDPQGPP